MQFEKFSKELSDILKSRGVQDECPYCHKDDWFIMERNGDFIFNKQPQVFSELGIPFIFMVCRNCGNIRLIEPSVLGFIGVGEIITVPSTGR